MHWLRVALTSLALPLILWGSASAADWPQFRGPNGDGIAPDDSAPTDWDTEKNVAWKVRLPRPGNGSPIVSNGSVFVACAEDEQGLGRSLYCFDRATGQQRWVQTVKIDKVMPTHQTNLYGGSTPAADGQRVVVWHASAGLHCYDFDGNVLWSRDLGEFRHMWGYGTSPIIDGNRVILHCGPGKKIRLMAFHLDDGKTLWEVEEPYQGDGDYNEKKLYMGSWSTPVVVPVKGKLQVICVMPTRVVAYDLESGDIVWYCEGVRGPKGDLAYSSPVIVDDICVVTGGFQGPGLAVRIGGTGNVTQSHRLWRIEKNPQSIGSAVAIDGVIYRPNAELGTIDCLDPKTGNIRWSKRAGGVSFWASMISANGLLYATDQDGTTIVFRPDVEEFQPIVKNELREPSNATPAISNGQIFIRTFDHLYCIGTPAQ